VWELGIGNNKWYCGRGKWGNVGRERLIGGGGIIGERVWRWLAWREGVTECTVLGLVAVSSGVIALSSPAVDMEYTFVLHDGIVGANMANLFLRRSNVHLI
jgi:hypothetical protein